MNARGLRHRLMSNREYIHAVTSPRASARVTVASCMAPTQPLGASSHASITPVALNLITATPESTGAGSRPAHRQTP